MKGYVISNKLYIFDTPAEIPYVDPAVEVIYVQEEYLAAFKTANSDYAALMKPYNFQVLTVKAKEWSGHENDDIVAPEPPAPTLYNISVGGSENQHVVLNENSAEAGTSIIVSAEAGWTYNTSADSDQIMVLTFSGVEAAYDDQNDQYTFTMPSNDVSIEAERYEAPVTTYSITLTGDYAEHVTPSWEGDQPEDTELTLTANEGYTFDEYSETGDVILGVRAFNASDESDELQVTYDSQNDTMEFTMPAYAVRVTVDEVQNDNPEEEPQE